MQLRMFGKSRREKRKRSALVPMQRRETAMRPAGAPFVEENEFAEMAAAQDTKLKPCKLRTDHKIFDFIMNHDLEPA